MQDAERAWGKPRQARLGVLGRGRQNRILITAAVPVGKSLTAAAACDKHGKARIRWFYR